MSPPLLVQSDRALLRLKALPIRLGLGVGVFATDIAVRLYHAHAAASSAKRPKTQTSDDTSSSERETLEAFAARAVELLRHALESDADGRFRRIQRVSLPDAGATSVHGLHAHRILLHTREYAASVASVDDALAALESKRLPIVFRDDALLVVDKPADMLSVGSGAYIDASDARFKRDVQPLDAASAAEIVRQLEGVAYAYRVDEFPSRGFGGRQEIGFLAQQVERVLPQVVTEDAEGFKFVAYARVVPVLVEALKHEQQQRQTLEQRVDAMQRQLEQLLAANLAA